MKLIMEQWRQHLKEEGNTAGATTNLPEAFQIEDLITDKFSFNSLQAPEHRFTPGQPVVDYHFDEQSGEWEFVAWKSSDPKAANETPDFQSEKGEPLDDFLTRVQTASSQMSLGGI